MIHSEEATTPLAAPINQEIRSLVIKGGPNHLRLTLTAALANTTSINDIRQARNLETGKTVSFITQATIFFPTQFQNINIQNRSNRCNRCRNPRCDGCNVMVNTREEHKQDRPVGGDRPMQGDGPIGKKETPQMPTSLFLVDQH